MTPAQILARKRLIKPWGLKSKNPVIVKDAKRIVVTVPIMGPAARRVDKAYRAAHPKHTIVKHIWQWNGSLGKRNGKAAGIVCHHAAASVASPKDIHRWHLARGFIGIGYHYYVRKDGSIHRGRPEWAIGAHCLGHNDMIGVCAEGNFETETMSAKQLEALQWLRADILGRYPGLRRYRHSDLNATACPGRKYPWTLVKG